eukprot:EG_transcript_12045
MEAACRSPGPTLTLKTLAQRSISICAAWPEALISVLISIPPPPRALLQPAASTSANCLALYPRISIGCLLVVPPFLSLFCHSIHQCVFRRARPRRSARQLRCTATPRCGALWRASPGDAGPPRGCGRLPERCCTFSAYATLPPCLAGRSRRDGGTRPAS